MRHALKMEILKAMRHALKMIRAMYHVQCVFQGASFLTEFLSLEKSSHLATVGISSVGA
jgi:hypothetical protein